MSVRSHRHAMLRASTALVLALVGSAGLARDSETPVAEQVAELVNRAAQDGQILAPERHQGGFKAGRA